MNCTTYDLCTIIYLRLHNLIDFAIDSWYRIANELQTYSWRLLQNYLILITIDVDIPRLKVKRVTCLMQRFPQVITFRFDYMV